MKNNCFSYFKWLLTVFSLILVSLNPIGFGEVTARAASAANATISSPDIDSAAIKSVTETNVMATSGSGYQAAEAKVTANSETKKSLTREATTSDAEVIDSGTIGDKGTATWMLDSQGVLHLGEGTVALNSNTTPWYSERASITRVEIEGPLKLATGYTSYNRLVATLPAVTVIAGLDQLDMSEVTSAQFMFYGRLQI